MATKQDVIEFVQTSELMWSLLSLTSVDIGKNVFQGTFLHVLNKIYPAHDNNQTVTLIL